MISDNFLSGDSIWLKVTVDVNDMGMIVHGKPKDQFSS